MERKVYLIYFFGPGHRYLQRRKWQPTLVFLPRESVDRGAWWAAVYGVAESPTRLKRLTMHACIGEGNGNPLQYSCLENPRNRGAWWATVHGVAQCRTRLKRLSSSSNIDTCGNWIVKFQKQIFFFLFLKFYFIFKLYNIVFLSPVFH